jgi:hypothetical protein
MEELKITSPFNLRIEVIEKEDYLQSFKASVSCVIDHPTGKIIYEADDIWFQCSVWDEFTSSLSTLDAANHSAVLPNMSDSFVIKIDNAEGALFCTLNIKETAPNDKAAAITYTSKIDFDDLAHLKSAMNNFDTWWR